MDEMRKTSFYLTLSNYKKIKKISYLSDQSMTKILNKILDGNLDLYLKKGGFYNEKL